MNVSLPTPPPLPGIAWRAISQVDLAGLVELADECQRVDGGLNFLNLPENLLDRCFPDAPGAGIGGFDAVGRLAAAQTVHRLDSPGAEVARITGQVHPAYRQRGLGAFLLHWGEAQARTLFSASAESRRLRIATESLDAAADRLYRAHGFQPADESLVMRFDLQPPLPDRQPPPGVTFIAWQIKLAGQFFQAYEAAFRERPGFPGLAAERWVGDWLENENARHEWSQLARAGGQPVGFLLASRERPGGYVVQVGVVPEWRRSGLGSALLVESLRRMQAAGEPSADLTVNLNNPGAIQAYIKLGFVVSGRRARYERPAD